MFSDIWIHEKNHRFFPYLSCYKPLHVYQFLTCGQIIIFLPVSIFICADTPAMGKDANKWHIKDTYWYNIIICTKSFITLSKNSYSLAMSLCFCPRLSLKSVSDRLKVAVENGWLMGLKSFRLETVNRQVKHRTSHNGMPGWAGKGSGSRKTQIPSNRGTRSSKGEANVQQC